MPSQRVVDVVILVNSRAFRNQSSMLDVFCLTKFYANTQGKSMKAGGVSANRLRRSKVFRRASQAFPDGMFQILPVHCWWLVLAQIELRARPRVDPSCSLRTSVFHPGYSFTLCPKADSEHFVDERYTEPYNTHNSWFATIHAANVDDI